ncbi:MAG: excinuclease ABC subunit UvrC [Spirochaetes bacterium]|nr:excinuclease ABC subunit UvrC [Spirochaetota bacterium]
MKNSTENRLNLEERVKELPENPGVYIMKNQKEEVIYVGKAKNLRSRVRSYFLKSASKELKTSHLVKKINFVEVITTATEYEALILENNLIKQWKPRYNISLKDSKTFPVIRITNEDFPKVFKTRRIIDDGSLYFGPYPDVRSIDIYLTLVKKQFKLRKCKEIPLRQRKAPCLYHHIKQCNSPCTKKADKKEYEKEIEAIVKILTGNIKSLEKELEKKMKQESAAQNYEKAAEYRNILYSIKTFIEEQKVEDFSADKKDVAALLSTETNCVIVVLQVREGKISGKSSYNFITYSDNEENMSRFFIQYYSLQYGSSVQRPCLDAEAQAAVTNEASPPAKVLVNVVPHKELLEKFFMEKFGVALQIFAPEDEKEASIMKMAEENCRLELMRMEKELTYSDALEKIKDSLGLSKIPLRIEGFDIAHLGGRYTVSSMVSFYNGKPDKPEYRIFKIKSLPANATDDYASIREAVARRYMRLKNEALAMPDLILIDGGKGQLNAALGVLEALEIDDINLAALAKQEELLFVPGKDEPIKLEEGTMPLRILQHVRDEAHRFATTFNKNMRKKEIAFSLLEEIPGIGAERSKKMLKEFGSMDNIKNSDVYSLSERAGLPIKVAEAVIEYLQNSSET